MKKNYIIFLIILVIQFISVFLYSSYAKATTSLSEFVNKYGINNMTEDERISKSEEILRKLEDYNEDTAITISSNVATILSNADNYKNYDEKIKFIEGEFATQAQFAIDEEALDYLYYGYKLGNVWAICKDVQNETSKPNNKIVAEQFDEKYNEYKKLKKEEKDVLTLEKYKETLSTLYNKLPKEDQTDERLKKLDEVETALLNADNSAMDIPDAIYQYPNKNGSTSAGSLDDMIGDADKFISSSTGEAITADSLQNFSNIFYNILLTIGIIVAVLVGSILGIKFMIGGAEEKANIKELLMPYIVGCIVVFGAFAIWKIVVTILSSM